MLQRLYKLNEKAGSSFHIEYPSYSRTDQNSSSWEAIHTVFQFQAKVFAIVEAAEETLMEKISNIVLKHLTVPCFNANHFSGSPVITPVVSLTRY